MILIVLLFAGLIFVNLAVYCMMWLMLLFSGD